MAKLEFLRSKKASMAKILSTNEEDWTYENNETKSKVVLNRHDPLVVSHATGVYKPYVCYLVREKQFGKQWVPLEKYGCFLFQADSVCLMARSAER